MSVYLRAIPGAADPVQAAAVTEAMRDILRSQVVNKGTTGAFATEIIEGLEVAPWYNEELPNQPSLRRKLDRLVSEGDDRVDKISPLDFVVWLRAVNWTAVEIENEIIEAVEEGSLYRWMPEARAWGIGTADRRTQGETPGPSDDDPWEPKHERADIAGYGNYSPAGAFVVGLSHGGRPTVAWDMNTARWVQIGPYPVVEMAAVPGVEVSSAGAAPERETPEAASLGA